MSKMGVDGGIQCKDVVEGTSVPTKIMINNKINNKKENN